MDEIVPRYEYRAFAPNFGSVAAKVRGASLAEDIRESVDTYIVSAESEESNMKIRGGKIDIKTLVQRDRGLEQWKPRLKDEFPLEVSRIREEIFEGWGGIWVPDFQRVEYTEEQLIEEVIRPHSSLHVAVVHKLRLGYTVNGCMAEIDQLRINGAALRSIAIEGEDPDAVLEAIEQVGLDQYENTNYVVAVQRVLGVVRLPETWV